jgi:hypothetical protein
MDDGLNLNIRPEILILAQKRTGNSLEAIGIGKDFLSRTPAAQKVREMIDKWDYMKFKSFFIRKEIVCQLKRPPTDGRKYSLAIHQTNN